MAQDRRSRCQCTLPFSLHLTVMILGIIGFIFTVVVTVLVFQSSNWYKSTGTNPNSAKGSAIWLLLSTVVIFVSGLQGLLTRPGIIWSSCRIFLSVINLINLGVLIVAFIFGGSSLFVIYLVAVFALELWAMILMLCCQPRKEPELGMTELPVANVGGVQQGHAVDMPATGMPFQPVYKVEPRPEAAGGPVYGHGHGQGRAYDQFEEVR